MTLEEKPRCPSARLSLRPRTEQERPGRKRRQEKDEGAWGTLEGWEGWQVPQAEPRCCPCCPLAWHKPEHLSNQDSLGTGAGQVFLQASGFCSLSNSYTCSSWTRLSSANSPELERRGGSGDNGTESGREGEGMLSAGRSPGGGGCAGLL